MIVPSRHGWVGQSGAAAAVMLPSKQITVIIFSTEDFIEQCVGCRNMFNQLSYRGGLDLMAVVPSFDCLCVPVHVCLCMV